MIDPILRLRLINQLIAESHLTDPADVVRTMGAVQAQDYGQALWAIGLRTKGATRERVVDAIESGAIVRTWPMRGTIHFVAAEDAKWMVTLAGERTLRSAAARHAGLDLNDKTFARAEELIHGALQGGKRLSRPKLMTLLENSGIATHDQRGYHILWTLSLKGVLCIGPMEGKQQTYALLDEWAPHPRHFEHDEALGELAKRYFTSHGPATLTDFATWSGQPQREAAVGLGLAKSHLTSLSHNGNIYWFGRETRNVPSESLHQTYMLAGFEEYLLGYKDRSNVVRPEDAKQFYINGIFFPIIVKDGRVVGGWRRTVTAKSIHVRLVEFEAPSQQDMQAIRAAASRYGDFMGLPLVFV